MTEKARERETDREIILILLSVISYGTEWGEKEEKKIEREEERGRKTEGGKRESDRQRERRREKSRGQGNRGERERLLRALADNSEWKVGR